MLENSRPTAEDPLFAGQRPARWINVCAWLLVALYGLGAVALVVVDATQHAAPARDFTIFWSAGRFALDGNASAAYDLSAGNGFPYPPTYLLLVMPLALWSFTAAFLAWTGVTLLAYLASLYAIVPRRLTILFGLAWPPVFWNFLGGQNGFLSAALIGGTLVLMESRPLVAAVLVGLLTYKPQLGLMLPVVLVLTGQWRVIASATATAIVFAGASYLAFGADTWEAFLRTVAPGALARVDGTWVSPLVVQTVYGLARSVGAGSALAWAAHGAVSLMVAAVVCWIWLRAVPFAVKAAALSLGLIIVTPYLAIYDFPAAAVPVAFLVKDGIERGFMRGEGAAIFSLALAPILLFVRAIAGLEAFPVMPAFAILLMASIVVRAASPTPALQTA